MKNLDIYQFQYFYSILLLFDLILFVPLLNLIGNKVRKLEFLMAEALNEEYKYDSVITIGGLQSNHARATAVAARQLGLDPFLILRTAEQPENINLVGKK